MNTFITPDIDYVALSPLLIVFAAGVLGIAVEALVSHRYRLHVQSALTFVGLAGALVAVGFVISSDSLATQSAGPKNVVSGQVLGSVVVDGPALVCQAAILALSLLTFFVTRERFTASDGAIVAKASTVPGSASESGASAKGMYQSEVFPLLMFCVSGMLLFPAANDLLTMFVALEVLSLPLYVLVGVARHRRLLSQEASLKYFLLGAFASALFAFGMALMYGFAGSVRLSDVRVAILGASATAMGDQPVPAVSGMEPLLVLAAVLLSVGLLFKVGAVPFHQWVPDVYQGAPSPITGFMGAVTKIAAFGAMLRLVYVALPGLQWDITAGLVLVGSATMLVGAITSVVQTDMKRMLAYSSITHAGFLLMGIAAFDRSGVSATLFYVVAYAIATVGIFALVPLLHEQTESEKQSESEKHGETRAQTNASDTADTKSVGALSVAHSGVAHHARDTSGASVSAAWGPGVAGSTTVLPDDATAGVQTTRASRVTSRPQATHLSQWAGLGQRHPFTAVVATVFMLTFMGIPLTSGFVGKFMVFGSVATHQGWILPAVGIIASVIAAFVYARVIVLMFFTKSEGHSLTPATVAEGGFGSKFTIGLTATACVMLGVAPAMLSNVIEKSSQFLM